jgi:hypothetical protein
MSAASAQRPSRLAAARQRAEDAKAALATGAVVLFSATGLAVAVAHPGHHKTVSSVQQQSEQDDTAESGTLSGGMIAPATSAPTASTSQS